VADEQLTGTLERILYYNEENFYCVGELRVNKSNASITITGNFPSIQCGETLQISGNWTTNPQYGKQFQVKEHKSTLPSTVYGIRKYLGSGLIPGVGKTYAEKIVDCFKEKTLEIISHESARLKEVPGIGAQRAKKIKKAWDEQHSLREVLLFLKTYGVGTAQCLRLVKVYGDNAQEILRNDPYRVAKEISGIGFRTIDKIALNIGLANDNPARIDAGIHFYLSERESDGHTCCPIELLENGASELLQTDLTKVANRIQVLVNNNTLVYLDSIASVQLPILHKAESVICQSIHSLDQVPSQLPSIIIDKAIAWAQEKAGFTFAPEQEKAIRLSLENKVSILTGGPGTGKTTILRAIVEILKAKKVSILLAAPTGRAAQRLQAASRHFAQTIHMLLKYDSKKGQFTHNLANPLRADFVIVDECSMLDTKLASSLFQAIPPQSHLLLVGDVHQLPSVGPGKILEDLIEHGNVPLIALNKVFRQKKQSSIVTTAHSILSGQSGAPNIIKSGEPLKLDSDLQFIYATTPEECVQRITQLWKTDLPNHYSAHPLKDIQVLAPLHKGIAGIENLNRELQIALNQNHAPAIQIGHTTYKVGDKVLQTRNNYDKGIFNGDLGIILNIDKENYTIDIAFERHQVTLERLDMPDISLAYAITIHKSQGSEFPYVIIPLLKHHFIMLQRTLLYTAITRGRKKVFIVGDPTAYAMAVNNVVVNNRQTHLRQKFTHLANNTQPQLATQG